MDATGKAARRAAAVAVHLFTAAGAAAAMLALSRALDGDFPAMFAWLGLCLFIDGIDGSLARAVGVKTHAAWIDGALLDLVVDFLTYVLVPVLAIWRSGLLASGIGDVLCPLVVMAAALYFADRRMKTRDNWFRGFPALWNVVALYLFVFSPPPGVNAALVAVLTGLMFAPVAFVHPLRVERFRALTLCVTMAWLACAAAAIAPGMSGGPLAKIGLACSGLYFLALTVWRSRNRSSLT